MMSTSTRTSPWQYEWKRPQWEKLPEDRAGLIDVTAAQVLGEEVGLERQDASKPLVLTVSLYDNGNILFLDVQDRTSQLKRRELRWPRSIMADESICSISLCRKPVKDDKRSHEDALEVLNRMALIPMFSTDFKFDTTTTQEDFEDIEIILQEPERPELVLACLTSRGNIMLYQVSQLLLVDGNDSDDQLAFEMANLILGVNLLEHIHQTMRPLSQPYATIALSVPFQQPAPQQQENPFGFKLPFDFKPPFQLKPVNIPFKLKQQEGVDIGIWDGSVWNARVEPSSAVYRTLNNEPINCTFLLKFLAVLGRGTRMRRTKKQKAGHGHADSNAGSVVDSTDTPSAERDDKEGRPEWLKENEADKFSEEAEWWKILEEDDIDVHEHNEVGGFVSFVGLLEAGEMRTVYLPFVPKAVYPLEWGGILFAIVIADDDCVYNCPKAVAIRLDTSGPSEVYCGATIGSDLTVDKDLQKKVKIKRFQPIPIDLPQEDQVSSTQLRVLGASKFYTQPPGMTILHAEGTTDAKDVVLTYHTLKSFDYVSSKEIDGWTKKDEFVLAVRTEKKQSHVAIVPNQVNEDAINKSWCEVGQGWSLVCLADRFYFVCWDGSTLSDGAFVTDLFDDTGDTLQFSSDVLPIDPFERIVSKHQDSMYEKVDIMEQSVVDLNLPFSSPIEMAASNPLQNALSNIMEDEETQDSAKIDDLVIEAMDSISSLSYRESTSLLSPGKEQKRDILSHHERSDRLLQHVESWATLDDTAENKALFEKRVPAILVASGNSQFLLSLRQVFVQNGLATPFRQILCWLSNNKDYYTAASIALGLLRDGDSLRDLRRLNETSKYQDERTNLEGLLDGIVPLYPPNDSKEALRPKQSVVTQVADMTIGCLVRGGFSMSPTLECFVKRDKNYDPARSGLMLAGVMTRCISEEKNVAKSVMGDEYEMKNDADPTDYLWALRALLEIGVTRERLAEAIVLVNVALPDELRCRAPPGSMSSKAPSLELCKAIVSTIVGCSPDAAPYLLGLIDEESRKHYWDSLSHENQLNFSLIPVGDTFPLLQQPEVRKWVLVTLKKCVEGEGSATAADVFDLAPTDWLKKVCGACIRNAGCGGDSPTDTEDDGICLDSDGEMKAYEAEIEKARGILEPASGVYGVDYGLVIPALLILRRRQQAWSAKSNVSTQCILDASCHSAGRHDKEEPQFVFDAPTVMRQCAISGNISAGAYLVGGKNGFVLQCCKSLIDTLDVDMDRAESIVLKDDIDYDTLKSIQGKTNGRFILSDEHRRLLWLLCEHVLKVRTFGNFHAVGLRGRVDPVFAARSCFRTWFLLSDSGESTPWLTRWLRQRLLISQGEMSPKRLACAALIRALVWPSKEGSDQILGTMMNIESTFLVQLARSCSGLVESVPEQIADEIITKADSKNGTNAMIPPTAV